MSTKAELILTIDGGGTSAKVSAYSVSARCAIASAAVEYTADYSARDLAEFDPATWWAAILRATRETVERANADPSSYLGITCTGMRIPFVLLDRAGVDLAPGVLNLDRRGHDYLEVVRGALGPERLYELSGHWPNSKFGLPKLLWFVDQRPELWRQVRHVLQFHDWLVFGLSGALVSEPSSAAMSQLVDVRARSWADELLKAVGLDRDLFPEMADAGSRAGGLLPEVARETGLLAGTPVHVGGGDSHVSALGAGGAHPGDVSIIGGSTTPVMLVSDEALLDPVHVPLVSPHLRRGLWAMESNAGITGVLYTWLRDITVPIAREGRTGADSYTPLDELAGSSPLGAKDLLVTCANPFWGEDVWESVPPISIVGLTPGHSLGDVARAILECICYAVRGNLDALEASLGCPSRRVVFTGGTSRSPLAAQMLADVLGRPVWVAEVREPSALAGAMLVLGEKVTGTSHHKLYEPDSSRHDSYKVHGERYRGLFARLQEAFA
jgi:sugar (pentulose or hexulose) kinase